MRGLNRRLLEAVGAGLLLLLATALFTWPLATRMDSAMPDIWDAKLTAWIFNWDFHQTLHDPFHLFDANIFFPARYALAFSENLYGAALFGFPLYAAGASPLFVENFLFLLGMWLSAMAAWLLAREITGDGLAAIVAGLVYAFVPWRLAQLPHVVYQWGAFLALALLFLLRYLVGAGRRNAVLFSVFLAWNALCNVHYAIFSGLLVLAVVGHETLAGGWKDMRGRVVGAGIAVAAAAVIVLPFYLPYEKVSRLYGMRRSWSEIEFYSGRPIDFLTAGPQNKLYAPLTQKWAHPEGDFFPGISVLGLAVFGALALRSRRPDRAERATPGPSPVLLRALDNTVGALLLLWLVAALQPGGVKLGPLSIGDSGRVLVVAAVPLLLRLTLAFPRWSRFANLPDFLQRRWKDRRAGVVLLTIVLGIAIALGAHTPFYRFLGQSFGVIFRAIRVPSRGITLFDLGLGVLAAWGLSLATRRLPQSGRLLATAAAVAVIGFEYRAFPIDMWDVDPQPPAVYRWLAAARFPGAAVHWPLADGPDIEHVFRSTAHWKPILNGYSGFGPPRYLELAVLLREQPMPASAWDKMEQMGAAVLVFHPDEVAQPKERLTWLQALREGVRKGRAVPLGAFPDGPSGVYAFRLAAAAPFETGIPEASPGAAAERVLRRLARLENVLREPFGWVDVPKEGELVAPGSGGFGWALDDSGIEQVLLTVDGSISVPVATGRRHPGVIPAYPSYPDVERAGFGFQIPALPPGPHELVFTFIAKDGGKNEFRRPIVVR